MAEGLKGTNAADLVDSVRAQIDSGGLRAGDALPSIRALAAQLGMNRNTVAAAYAQLSGAGLVETRRRGGTLVRGVPHVDGEGQYPGGDLVDLSSGNPDPAFVPGLPAGVEHGYTPPLYGAPSILDELQEWVAANMAPDVTGRHRLVLTHGAVDAVERLLAAHLTRGDMVAVEEPCFLSSIGILRWGGYRSVPVPVDDEGMTVAGLRAAVKSGVRAVVITPRAHNPTGASLTLERAAELRAVLTGHPEVLVIEDDHFSCVSSTPYMRVTPPDAPRWALVRSMSKSLGPDVRIAFVLTDPATATRLESRLSAGTTWVSHILQHITCRLLTDPSVQTLIARARSTYAERSRMLIDALTTKGIAPQDHVDGLNVWVPLGRDARTTVSALAERGWAVRPDGDFTVSSRPSPALRVTSAILTAEQASAFAADLAQILQHPPSHSRHA